MNNDNVIDFNNLGHWKLNNNLSLPKILPFGFIYLIECKINQKKYIGKKQLFSYYHLSNKNKKRRKLKVKESDWRTYTGSSHELNKDIEKYGKENFNFIILDWCYSKFELKYKELKYQIENDVLLKENWYNGIIQIRLSKCIKK